MGFENLEAFQKELDEFTRDLTPGFVSVVQRKLALDIYAGVVKRTPVDNGRARGGWMITIGDPGVGEPSKGANQVLALNDLPKFSVVYISNNVPYIVVLDQGGYVPANPDDSKEARAKRAAGRDEIRRDRAEAAFGDPGATFVFSGFSWQAPNGMVDLAIGDVRKEFNS